MTPDHASALDDELGPETLARVLEGLRALDTAAPRSADAGRGDDPGPDVVPLPRRR